MFKRRNRLGLADRAREWLSPRKGWRRGFEYLGHRVQRLPDTPHRIALGLACGAMASFTPFFGFHFVIAALLAWAAGGNMLASAFGTFIGNPATFPLIAGASLWMGSLLTGAHVHERAFSLGAVFSDIHEFLHTLFLPYLVGGVLPGLAASAATYWVARSLVAAYQSRRRAKLMKRAKERMAAHLRARRQKPAE